MKINKLKFNSYLLLILQVEIGLLNFLSVLLALMYGLDNNNYIMIGFVVVWMISLRFYSAIEIKLDKILNKIEKEKELKCQK